MLSLVCSFNYSTSQSDLTNSKFVQCLNCLLQILVFVYHVSHNGSTCILLKVWMLKTIFLGGNLCGTKLDFGMTNGPVTNSADFYLWIFISRYIGFIKLEPSFITIFFCALEGSRLSHSFVSFLGRDRAPDFEIRFCLKMENKCCSYLTLTNRRAKGRAKTIHSSWKVSQHFALEASLTAATERYFNFETLHRLDENCTEIKRNLNRSYLLQKEAFPIKDSIHLCTKGMGHTDGTRRNRILGMRKIYLVCKIYALVCTELTAVGQS